MTLVRHEREHLRRAAGCRQRHAGARRARHATGTLVRHRASAQSGPYTNEEVAEAANKESGRKLLSTTGIWQLRKGQRTEPSYQRLVALANFFGVKPEYFYDDHVARRTDEELEVLAAMRDKDVRDVAMRSARLSPKSLAAVKAMIDAAYELEGIPKEPEA
ncbi:hypothetical protein ACFQ9X_17720 [Catenulispora yoronensis]